MVPMSPNPGGQTEQYRVRHGPYSPGRTPTPWSPTLNLKLVVLPLRNSDRGQAPTPQLCEDQAWEPQGWAGFNLWPPASVERLSPGPRRPLPSSDTMESGTELQAWGCPRAQEGLQDPGLRGPWLECLKLRDVGTRGPHRDQIRIQG